MPRYPIVHRLGLDVIVVGSVISGLVFGIEAVCQGHKVYVLKKRFEPGDYGMRLARFSSSNRPDYTLSRWPDFVERLHKVFGTQLGSPDLPTVSVSRKEFYRSLFDYPRELGILVETGREVEEFFEIATYGGVILSDNRRVTANIVVAADGVGSKSFGAILGRKKAPISSGFALYRSSFLINKREWTSLHIGPGAYFFVGMSPAEFGWILTHKDDGSAIEDWNRIGGTEIVYEVIERAPKYEAMNWKLRFRDPQPKWVSDGGRLVQCGDAAHSILPSSGFGATMAIEDAISLAARLRLGRGQSDPLATKVFNHLRFERATCAQKIGSKSHQDPRSLIKLTGKSLVRHDPELYVYENYETCMSYLVSGEPFKNSNTVPGFTFKHWTAKELREKMENGESIEDDDGDWYS
ncbi:FAD/NAD(P)-binding domain-containing protein [Karstenula rhodostoma CBS 690.94]|uniref:FAD/NAD(P)-binding domain-containing protein n=1 Tax=Karstenula rhodostoma CBS 690.94 TaxID=1392251 RepID=A0A9P4PRT6_9PLEO|nr:FAD/NAD(P)-binding domain-containing protein [Karstenula rhodostoma CBS 690.94]